jgi:hypothetical protein
MARQRRVEGAAPLPAGLDASIGGHGGQGPIRPDDMALWDPATGQATRAGRPIASQPGRDLSTLRTPAHCHPGQARSAYPQSGGYGTRGKGLPAAAD